MNIRSEIGMRINTRLETFLAKELGIQNVEFYDQEPCVEVLPKSANIFAKYPFRILIVCKEKIIITNNPPKKEDLDRFINFTDILEIKAVSDLFFCLTKSNSNLNYSVLNSKFDDIPAFLGNPDRDKALHIR